MARPTATSLGLSLGTRPAGTPVGSPLGGTPKIMAAGDSIVLGSGSTDGGGWRKPLDVRLADAGIARSWVGPTTDANGLAHYGNSGWKIADLDADIATRIATYDPDILLLAIGRNNMPDGTDASNAPTHYASLLATIYTAKPALRIVCGHITPEEDATRWGRTQTFRAAIPAVWEASDAYSDGLLIYCGAGLDLAPLSRNHLGDGVHPTDAGYSMIADRWWPALVNAYGLAAAW